MWFRGASTGFGRHSPCLQPRSCAGARVRVRPVLRPKRAKLPNTHGITSPLLGGSLFFRPSGGADRLGRSVAVSLPGETQHNNHGTAPPVCSESPRPLRPVERGGGAGSTFTLGGVCPPAPPVRTQSHLATDRPARGIEFSTPRRHRLTKCDLDRPLALYIQKNGGYSGFVATSPANPHRCRVLL